MELWAHMVTDVRMVLKGIVFQRVRQPTCSTKQDSVSYFSHVIHLYNIYAVDYDSDLYHNIVSNIQTST